MPARTSAWIDVPVDGITVPEGETLKIKGHASSLDGVNKVEIWVNGELLFEIFNPASEKNLAKYSQEWTPPGPGDYTIQVLALAEDGTASEPANAVVRVGAPLAEVETVPEAEPAAEEPTPTETPTPTPTPPPSAPEVVIEFWADPGEINAGDEFTVYWHVENVSKVIFGGIDQPFDGTFSDELCKNQRYTLTVVHTDGSEEKRSVDIRVNGDCDIPEAESSESSDDSGSDAGGDTSSSGADTTAPPVPNQLKPVNGSDIGCVSKAMMRWEAVSDSSGIAEYQVEVQRHAGDNNWQAVSGSVFTGIGATEKELSVECGWEYRWRVRAMDGASNTGNWSGWFSFIVPLT